MNQEPETGLSTSNEVNSELDAAANEVELTDEQLQQVNGGLLPAVKTAPEQPTGLLLPAVQKIREAAARL